MQLQTYKQITRVSSTRTFVVSKDPLRYDNRCVPRNPADQLHETLAPEKSGATGIGLRVGSSRRDALLIRSLVVARVDEVDASVGGGVVALDEAAEVPGADPPVVVGAEQENAR